MHLEPNQTQVSRRRTASSSPSTASFKNQQKGGGQRTCRPFKFTNCGHSDIRDEKSDHTGDCTGDPIARHG